MVRVEGSTVCSGTAAGEGRAPGGGPEGQMAAGNPTWVGAGSVCLGEMLPCPSLGRASQLPGRCAALSTSP